MPDVQKRFLDFVAGYPEIARAYEQLGSAVHLAGPVPAKERALITLGIAIGARVEGAVHSHVRNALEAGATAEEIRHAALLALPTIGFPAVMTVLTWIEKTLPAKKKSGKKRRH